MIKILREIAELSDDPITQVGAALSSPSGAILLKESNRFAHAALRSADRIDAENRYHWLLHAEARLIAKCAAYGITTRGRTVSVSKRPCHDCANLMIAAEVGAVQIYRDGTLSNRWADSCTRGELALREAGVPVIWL